MIQEILRHDYYLVIMLVIGIGLGALGRHWSNEERKQRQNDKTKSP